MNQTDTDRRERYAAAIHDAMETDLSLVDQEPAFQALIARAAEAAMALADAELAVPSADQNRQFLTTLANLGITSHRLNQIRDAARLHRQQLIGTNELYAVIDADDSVQPAAASAVVSPPTDRAAEELAKHVTRAIFALKTPPPPGSQHYRSGWDDGLEAAMDAARDALLAAEAHGAGAQQQDAPSEWCKCRACWGWFVEEHPGEDLTELGTDLGWWSGLPEHRDAPAGAQQQPDTEAHANGLPLVKGNCPACRQAALFLGAGGYPTCSNWECPEPDAATTVLEQYANEAHPPQHAWRVETRDGEWVRGSHFLHRQAAVERYETANSTAPLWQDGTPIERRIVRETTTYTVEEPAPVAQQPAAEAPRCDAGFVFGGRCTKPAGHPDPHAPASVAEQPAAADDEDPPEPQRDCTCKHPADEHSVYGCVDDCGCEWMPRRSIPRS